MFQLTRF